MTIDPNTVAIDVVRMAQTGLFAELRERFAEPLRPMVAPETLQAAWASEVDPHGGVLAIGTPTSEAAGPTMTSVRVPVELHDGSVTVVVMVHDSGAVAGLQLLAGIVEPERWQAPGYADPSAYVEHDLVLGDGDLAVPATVTVPRGAERVPGVVLLAGSGPNDRDAKIVHNLPFRDLAWGLASRGIAVLRFDKVTFAHARAVAAKPSFTMTDEYVPDAVAAVAALQATPGVDPDRVFIAGHSQGGTVAPRVAYADPNVAGLILLAAGAQPMHWSAVRQLRYLAGLNPVTAELASKTLDVVTQQAAAVDGPDLAPDTPPDGLLFGLPAPYWLDVRSYDPVAAAVHLDLPILVLQGGRDYQATVADDLALWREGLAGRSDVTIRVFDADNHFFFPGTGVSTPAEYETVNHVDPDVIDTIIDWLG
jgi:dienelactone hydrolase